MVVIKRMGILFLVSVATSGLHADDVLNIRTDPMMIFGAHINLEVDVRLSNYWSLGPYVQASTIEPLYQVGLRATHFESQTFNQGWQTGIEAGVKQVTDYTLNYNSAEDSFCEWQVDQEVCGLKADHAITLALDHGYMWRWGTFNVDVGVGAVLSSKIGDFGDVSLLPKVQFAIGWIR